MMKKILRLKFNLTFIAVVLLIFVAYNVFGESTVTISGNTSVAVGDIITYEYDRSVIPSHEFNSPYSEANWYIEGGVIVDKESSVMTTWVKVQWLSGGSGTVEVNIYTDSPISYDYYEGLLNVSVSGCVAPSTPNTSFNKSYNCASTVVTRTGNPPSGETWYWQTSATGTSKSNSSASITRTSTGSLYLRAYSTSCNTWSVNSYNDYIFVNSATPSKPNTVISSIKRCSSTKVERSGNPPTGVKWYWQTSANGTSKQNSASSFVWYSSGYVYLRAYKTCSNTWSSSSKSYYVSVNTDNVISSVRDGNWNSSSTWRTKCGVSRVPKTGDIVTVDHKITGTSLNFSGGSLNINSGYVLVNKFSKTGGTVKVQGEGLLMVRPSYEMDPNVIFPKENGKIVGVRLEGKSSWDCERFALTIGRGYFSDYAAAHMSPGAVGLIQTPVQSEITGMIDNGHNWIPTTYWSWAISANDPRYTFNDVCAFSAIDYYGAEDYYELHDLSFLQDYNHILKETPNYYSGRYIRNHSNWLVGYPNGRDLNIPISGNSILKDYTFYDSDASININSCTVRTNNVAVFMAQDIVRINGNFNAEKDCWLTVMCPQWIVNQLKSAEEQVEEQAMLGNLLECNIKHDRSSKLILVSLNKQDVNGIIELYDLSGKTILKSTLIGSEGKLNLSGIQEGMYLVVVKTELGSAQERIIM
ncbi:MAG: T9SS type A sorting domain-containing protein [Bacteroidales bacterium]|nr:T9SS type A sorting domain-containing protein [Bacteroidales bacterium]